MWIRRRNGRAICFRCGSKWSWRALVSKIARVSMQDAYAVLFGEGAGDELEAPMENGLFDEREEEDSGEKTDRPILIGPDFVGIELSPRGLDYLIRRGVTDPGTILAFDIRYHAMMDAVVFPIRHNGVTYGWQARKIAPQEGELRLISSRFNKSHFLLNYDRARIQKRLIVVEGPFDCAHTDVQGYGSVASLGKGVSLDQIDLILRSEAEELYLGLDPDASEEVYELVDLIGLKKRVYRARPPEHREDFGEATMSEVEESMRVARPMVGATDVLEVFFK
jgi:hypothetical protein